MDTYLEHLIDRRIKRIQLLRQEERQTHYRVLEGIMLGIEESTLMIIGNSFNRSINTSRDIISYRGTESACLAIFGFKEHAAIIELNRLYYDKIRSNGIKEGYRGTAFYGAKTNK